MSIDAMLIKTDAGVFAPATIVDAETLAKLSVGKPLGCTIKTLRNGQYHRKLFKLLGYLYDVLPRKKAEYKGEPVEQSFDRFRADMVILSGHYEVDVAHDGKLRLEAHSLSYSQCTQEKAEQIYSSLINKALDLLGEDMTREGLEDIVKQLLDFD